MGKKNKSVTEDIAYNGIIWLDDLDEEEDEAEGKTEEMEKEANAGIIVSYASIVPDEIDEDILLEEAILIDKFASALMHEAKTASIIDDTVDLDKFIENVYSAAFAIVTGFNSQSKSAAKGKYKFEKDPDKWKKFWNTLTGNREHKITACIKKLKKSRKDKIDDPEAFCNALAKFVGYKKGKSSRKASKEGFAKVASEFVIPCELLSTAIDRPTLSLGDVIRKCATRDLILFLQPYVELGRESGSCNAGGMYIVKENDKTALVSFRGYELPDSEDKWYVKISELDNWPVVDITNLVKSIESKKLQLVDNSDEFGDENTIELLDSDDRIPKESVTKVVLGVAPLVYSRPWPTKSLSESEEHSSSEQTTGGEL